VGDSPLIDIEESGMQVCVGLGGYERLGETYFGWRQGEPYQTAEVTLDLELQSELPIEAAREILRKLRLPIERGMNYNELITILGTPITDNIGRPGLRLLKFVCGEGELFVCGCCIDDKMGLVNVFLARKDYFDESN